MNKNRNEISPNNLSALLPEEHRGRSQAAGAGASLGAAVGSVLGGPVGAAIGGAAGALLGVLLTEQIEG
jgi:hypothetical protein